MRTLVGNGSTCQATTPGQHRFGVAHTTNRARGARADADVAVDGRGWRPGGEVQQGVDQRAVGGHRVALQHAVNLPSAAIPIAKQERATSSVSGGGER